jgi:hypothetical protein
MWHQILRRSANEQKAMDKQKWNAHDDELAFRKMQKKSSPAHLGREAFENNAADSVRTRDYSTSTWKPVSMAFPAASVAVISR